MRKTYLLKAENGKWFELEDINPWELAPGDHMYSFDHPDGFVSILGRGACTFKASEYRPGETIRTTPVLAFWRRYGTWDEAGIWNMSYVTVSRVIREVVPCETCQRPWGVLDVEYKLRRTGETKRVRACEDKCLDRMLRHVHGPRRRGGIYEYVRQMAA